MRLVTIALQTLSAVAALYAAYCWWVASTGRIDPGWTVEPSETEAAQSDWIAGIMNSVVESAKLNKRAAWWTGVAVLLGAFSSILSLVTSPFA